jgi:hypothetical protein
MAVVHLVRPSAAEWDGLLFIRCGHLMRNGMGYCSPGVAICCGMGRIPQQMAAPDEQ